MAESIIPNHVDHLRPRYPGVTLEETSRWDCYSGIAEALLAAGLIRMEQLPGSAGMPKTAVTFYDGRQVGKGPRVRKDEGYLNIVAKGKRLEVRRGLPAEVKAARVAERDAEWAANRAIRTAVEEAEQHAYKTRWIEARMGERTLKSMVNSTQEYRDKGADSLRSFVDIAIHSLQPNNQSGYCLDKDAIGQLTVLRDQMLQVVAEAFVVFDAAHHKMVAQHCKAAIAKDDAGFQKSLGNMIGGSQ